MAESAIKVLLVEDDADDYVLTRALLTDVPGRTFAIDWEPTYAGGLAALARDEHDVCIVDYHLGEHSGLDLLHATADTGRNTPLIVLTGSAGNEQTDIAAMLAGADDFLVKGSIDATILDRSIRYAIERRRLMGRLVDRQKLESLGILAGGLAHDFNNLLLVIIGNAELAVSELPADSPARLSLEQIGLAAHRGAELSAAMLAYSGTGRLVVEEVQLPAVVAAVGTLVAAGTVAPIQLAYRFADGVPTLEVDADQIGQVVMNLFVNAAEALGAAGGSIEARVTLVDDIPGDGFRFAEALPPGPYVRLEVEDDGPGMDDDTLARLFDPFFTTKFTGRGLGLAAVLGIVRGHSGAIRVTSEPGNGSVFDVLFPLARPPV